MHGGLPGNFSISQYNGLKEKMEFNPSLQISRIPYLTLLIEKQH